MPTPQLCYLRKAYHEQDYGFKLLIDKKDGVLVSHVDSKSPADLCGLKVSHLVLTVNDVPVVNKKYKEISELVNSNPLECKLLIILHDDALWFKDQGFQVPLDYATHLPLSNQLDLINAYRNNVMSHISSTASDNNLNLQPDSCFACPWRSRRVLMTIVITFGFFISASIIGSMIRRFSQPEYNYSIRWNSVTNLDNGHILNLEFDHDDSKALFLLTSPWFNRRVKSTALFNKRVIIHQLPSIDWCFITAMDQSILPIDVLKESAKSASTRTRALKIIEDMNYYVKTPTKEAISDFNSYLPICHENFAELKKEEDILYKNVECKGCEKLCLPNYVVATDTSGIQFLSIGNGSCIWYFSQNKALQK